MSLRLLYTLAFALIVLILSVLSSIVIYKLYENYREDIFVNELQHISDNSNDYFLHHRLQINDSSTKQLDIKKLQNKELFIINSQHKILFAYPSNLKVQIDSNLLKNKYQQYFKNFFSYTLIDYNKSSNYFIVVKAVDEVSASILPKLYKILLIVPLLFCIIAFVGGNIIVYTAVKPLLNLSKEIETINENNLTTPVKVANYISETTKLAININKLLARLSEAFKTQKNFIHHASHELRTPLATMYATTQAALQGEYTTEEYKAILQSLKQDQNNLIELTNALLLLSQFEKLQHKPQWQVIRIDDLLYESMAYTKKLFNGMVIDFAFNTIPDNEEWLQFKASEALLRSAFTNLIKNAYLYSNNQKAIIILVAEKNCLEIHFENEGKHLSETEVSNLKEPFLQSNNVGQVKGFGLGLSIVQRIATIHNAKFTYNALALNKNRFTIKLK